MIKLFAWLAIDHKAAQGMLNAMAAEGWALRRIRCGLFAQFVPTDRTDLSYYVDWVDKTCTAMLCVLLVSFLGQHFELWRLSWPGVQPSPPRNKIFTSDFSLAARHARRITSGNVELGESYDTDYYDCRLPFLADLAFEELWIEGLTPVDGHTGAWSMSGNYGEEYLLLRIGGRVARFAGAPELIEGFADQPPEWF